MERNYKTDNMIIRRLIKDYKEESICYSKDEALCHILFLFILMVPDLTVNKDWIINNTTEMEQP